MNIKSFLLLILISVLINVSCKKDFEQINNNPQAFTTASDGSLFNSVVSSCILGWNEEFYVNEEKLYPQTQLAAQFKQAWENTTIGTEEIWSNYYNALPNFRELEKRFAADAPSNELNNMIAMLKIMRAYKTYKVTDLFGDIPYSEAGYGFQDISKLHPKFDSQQSIYLSLLDDLAWADANINTAATAEPYATFKVFDKLFFGDLTMWKKFANSLRLRYAMRMYSKQPTKSAQIIGDIISNPDKHPVLVGCDINGYTGDVAAIYPYLCGYKDQRQQWAMGQQNLRMGSNMWHQLSAHDSIDGSGIFDARAYLFFDTNNKSKWVAYPNVPNVSTPAESGVPYATQRNSAAGYAIKGATCLFSPFNYFFVSDQDYIPDILMTGAEVNFLKAEAFLRGIGVAADPSSADNEFLSGVNASFVWWQTTMGQTSLLNDGSKFNTMVTIPTTLTYTLIQSKFDLFNFTSTDDRLKQIYTQEYIDLFRQVQEAYALVRRVPSGLLPREGNALNYYRFTIPPSEVQYNLANYQSCYSSQADAITTKVWWMQ
ncbi:MAG: SusD/RagB family nutrient-binding outer membrane lipoprotein [Bacteroidota bacterium]